MEINAIAWDNIVDQEDVFITYLLYKEGKSIDLISRIRNISREKIEKDIIEAKIKLHNLYLDSNKKKKRTFEKLLELSKDDRLNYIKTLDTYEKNELLRDIKQSYDMVSNPDDKMLLIWIIGELNEEDLVNLISKDVLNRNGNIGRMVCSALGKIKNVKSKNVLHRALSDKKPQVRQYAAKALKNVGDFSSIKLLNNILKDTSEKDYVKRTCLDTIKFLEKNIHYSSEEIS